MAAGKKKELRVWRGKDYPETPDEAQERHEYMQHKANTATATFKGHASWKTCTTPVCERARITLAYEPCPRCANCEACAGEGVVFKGPLVFEGDSDDQSR